MEGWRPPPFYEKFFIPAGFTTQAIKWLEICRSGEKSLTPPFIFCSYIFIFFLPSVLRAVYRYIHIYTHIYTPAPVNPGNSRRMRTKRGANIADMKRMSRIMIPFVNCTSNAPTFPRIPSPPFFLRPSGLFPRILFK